MLGVIYCIVPNSIDLDNLRAQISSSELPPLHDVTISPCGTQLFVCFSDELSTEHRGLLDNIIESVNSNVLELLKDNRKKEIDEKTSDIISAGFLFRGIIFSGSVQSQNRIMGAYLAKDMVTYPIRWFSKDDMSYLDITDSEMLIEFFATGFGALKSKIDIGSALKLSINNANSIEEVNAIVDER